MKRLAAIVLVAVSLAHCAGEGANNERGGTSSDGGGGRSGTDGGKSDAGGIGGRDGGGAPQDSGVSVAADASKSEAPAPWTIGWAAGGGNIHPSDATSHMIGDLVALHASVGRLSLYPDDMYFVDGAPSPSRIDAVVLAMLHAGVRPYVIFEFESSYDSAAIGKPERNYADWRAIGQAFAARFKPNSAFLVGAGVSDAGIVEWSAINEVDRKSGEDPALTYAQYREMLRGLAEGVHASHADGKVYPAGYLAANRDGNYTAHGYLPAIAGLINDRTLAGFDLHTYMDKSYAPLFDRYDRSFQRDFERCIEQSGITRIDIDWVSTEHNVKADPDASRQGYDETTARSWFLTHFFDMHGAVRADGTPAPGVRLVWNLWRQAGEPYYMAASLVPRVPRWTGHTYKMLLDLLHDMFFVASDPASGTFKLEGGGKTAWVFQNLHPTWSTKFGDSFTIADIPADATKVDVYDGNGLVNSVADPSKPSHTFETPTGRSYLFIADAE
jgi:hypothetical protein